MSNTLKLGNGKWATGKDTLLSFSDTNNNYKPLPFSFSRASSGTVINKDGLIETVGTGKPRIDFKDNTKGSLLLEPQRTNVVINSSDASSWSSLTSGGTVTKNGSYAISPNGTETATRLQASVSGSGYALITLAIDSSFVGNYTSSVYVKSNTNSSQEISFYGRNSTNNAHTVGSEWKRIEFQGSSASGQTNYAYIGVSTSITSEDIDILVWGGQLEQGSYATSYIHTSGSAVTRVADVCNKGGNEQVFNDNDGVIYSEISALADDLTFRLISLKGSSQDIRFGYRSNSNMIYVQIGSAAFLTHVVSDITNYNKVAISYGVNGTKFTINGVTVGVDLDNSSIANMSSLNFDLGGGSNFLGKVKDFKIYNEALTDQELQALTS